MRVALAAVPKVTVMGKIEQDMPVGSWKTMGTRVTPPCRPSRLVTVMVEVVVVPTRVVKLPGLEAMEKS